MANQRSSIQITQHTVRRFVEAIPAEGWRIAYGMFGTDGRLIRTDRKRHEFLSAEDVVALIPYCRARNADQMSIYIGLMTHSALYVDDVTADSISRLDGLCLPTRAIVETSPGSHQVWFPIPAETSAWALSAALCRLLGGDAKAHESSSTRQPRLARLPGFTNSKPSRQMPDGRAPFVKLVTSTQRPPSPAHMASLTALANSDQSHWVGNPHTAGRARSAAREKADLRSAAGPARSDNRDGQSQSEADWHEVRAQLRAGASFEDSVAYLTTHRPEKRGDYARRTVARAAYSLGRSGAIPDDPELWRYCESLRMGRE